MGGLAALLFVPILAYIAVQSGRDIRARAWVMSTWGLVTALLVVWMIVRLMSGPQH